MSLGAAPLTLGLEKHVVGTFTQPQVSKLKAHRVGADLVKSKGIGHKLDMLAKQIQDGAKAFLEEEYKWLALFVCFMAIVLLILFTVAHDDGADASQVRVAKFYDYLNY